MGDPRPRLALKEPPLTSVGGQAVFEVLARPIEPGWLVRATRNDRHHEYPVPPSGEVVVEFDGPGIWNVELDTGSPDSGSSLEYEVAETIREELWLTESRTTDAGQRRRWRTAIEHRWAGATSYSQEVQRQAICRDTIEEATTRDRDRYLSSRPLTGVFPATDREDVYQDGVWRALRSGWQLRWHPPLTPRAAFRPWFFTILRNLCADRGRRRDRQQDRTGSSQLLDGVEWRPAPADDRSGFEAVLRLHRQLRNRGELGGPITEAALRELKFAFSLDENHDGPILEFFDGFRRVVEDDLLFHLLTFGQERTLIDLPATMQPFAREQHELMCEITANQGHRRNQPTRLVPTVARVGRMLTQLSIHRPFDVHPENPATGEFFYRLVDRLRAQRVLSRVNRLVDHFGSQPALWTDLSPSLGHLGAFLRGGTWSNNISGNDQQELSRYRTLWNPLLTRYHDDRRFDLDLLLGWLRVCTTRESGTNPESRLRAADDAWWNFHLHDQFDRQLVNRQIESIFAVTTS